MVFSNHPPHIADQKDVELEVVVGSNVFGLVSAPYGGQQQHGRDPQAARMARLGVSISPLPGGCLKFSRAADDPRYDADSGPPQGCGGPSPVCCASTFLPTRKKGL